MDIKDLEAKDANTRGMLFVIISTVLWAINGNIGVYLFRDKGVTPEHLTMFRLVFSGVILLIYQYIYIREEVFNIFHNRDELIKLVYFAFCGILVMQYGYFVAVKHSNAATATILQSLAPFIIVIITSINYRRLPSKSVLIALIIALVGTFLIVTHGRVDQIAITKSAFIFGMIAVFGCVNYNLVFGALQEKYSTILVLGWAMTISGIGFSLVFRPWRTSLSMDIGSVLGILYVTLLGTLFPFLFHLTGLKNIGAQKASILSLVEPVMSTIIAVAFMGAKLFKIDFMGIGMVVCALLLLALN
ncbi:MAG: DMT family transporter [Tissierellaceae bacterium]